MKTTRNALCAGAVASLWLLIAQPAAAADAAPAKPAAAWKVPRTAWGDPDLRGQWPLDYLAGTPRVRPASLGNRAQLTDEEYAAAIKAAENQKKVYAQEVKNNRMGMGHWTERGEPLRQTSLTVEPANGRMPPATPEGVKRSLDMKSSWSEDHWDWVTDFSAFDLCITRGMPGSMLPGAYNMGIGIYQAPGLVAITLEMVHETRIIPLDGEGPPPAPVKGWLGFSRGHWEGNTLVIETTNFVPGVALGNADNAQKPIPNSDQMTMTERLTPTGPNEIRFEAWIKDPVTLSAPFKLDFPWRRHPGYEQYEYACHEGNVQTRGFITSSRAQRAIDRDAVRKAQASQSGSETGGQP